MATNSNANGCKTSCCVFNFYTKTVYNPNPTRLWSRFNYVCPCPPGQPSCSTDFLKLDERRKAEILKYKANSSNITKKQQYANAASNRWLTSRKRSWATQTDTYTNPNTSALQRVGDVLVCNNNNVSCALTSSSDVPGKIQTLCYNPTVPLYNYKVTRTYSSGGTKWPQYYGPEPPPQQYTTTTVYDWRNLAIGQSKTFTISDGLYQPYQLEVGYNIKIVYSDTDSITGTITAITSNNMTLTITAFTTATYVVVPLITTTSPNGAIAGSPINPIFILNGATTTPTPPEISANTFITNGLCYLYSTFGNPNTTPFTISVLGTNIVRPTSNQALAPLFENPTVTSTPFIFPIDSCFIETRQVVSLQANTAGQPIEFGFPNGGSFINQNFCGVIYGYTLPYTPLGVITV